MPGNRGARRPQLSFFDLALLPNPWGKTIDFARCFVSYCAYQSECGDQRAQERHCVKVHWRRQEGQTPPVSKVFQIWPHEHAQRSSFRGDQPHSGHRMRGPDGSSVFSCSTSGSTTTDDCTRSSKAARVKGFIRPCCHRYNNRTIEHSAQFFGSVACQTPQPEICQLIAPRWDKSWRSA